jgi:hypothetical protein
VTTAQRLSGNRLLYRLTVATLCAPTDPTYALQGALLAPVVHHRPAITDERPLGTLMVSIDEYAGWPTLNRPCFSWHLPWHGPAR